MSEVVPYDVFKMIFYHCDTITQFRIKQTNHRNSQLVIKSINDVYHKLSDAILERYSELEELIHTAENITDKGLMKLSKLKILEIGGEAFNDIKMNNKIITDKSIVNLINLEKLSIDFVDNIYEITDMTLGKLTKLKNLKLVENEQLSCIININNELGNLVNLTLLDINSNANIDDNILVKLKNLEKLILSNNDCKGTFLKNNSKIIELSIYECHNIDDDNLTMMDNLKKLEINNCNGLNGFGLGFCSKLTDLSITACENIIDDCLLNLISIKELQLYCCNNIKGYGLQNLINVENLSICYCKNMTDTHIANMVNLKNLYLNNNISMEGSGIKILENISIRNCPNINSKNITVLRKIKQIYIEGKSKIKVWKMVNLEKLRIEGYNRLNDKNIIYLCKLKELTLTNIPNIKNISIVGLKFLNRLTMLVVSIADIFCNKNIEMELWVKYIKNAYKLYDNLSGYNQIENQYIIFLNSISDNVTKLVDENRVIEKNFKQLKKKKKEYKKQKSKVKKIIKNFK